MQTKSYKQLLSEVLDNPHEAMAYLNAALEEEDPRLFLVALRNIVDAQGGMSQLAEATELSRGSLYRTLSIEGNPRLSSLETVLGALGFRICIGSADKRCLPGKASSRKRGRKSKAKHPRA